MIPTRRVKEMGRRLTALCVVVAACAVVSDANARSYNPNLGVFLKNGVVDTAAFKSYAGELGLALSPSFVGPASGAARSSAR